MSLTISSVEPNFFEIENRDWDKYPNEKKRDSIEYDCEDVSYMQFFNLRCSLAKLIGWNYYYNSDKKSAFNPEGTLMLRSDESNKHAKVLHKFFLMPDSDFELTNAECRELYSIFKDQNVVPDERMVRNPQGNMIKILDTYSKLMSILKSAIDNKGIVIGT